MHHRPIIELWLAALVSLGTACSATSGEAPSSHVADAPPAASGATMVVARAGSQPASKGPAANFTGEVTVTPLFSPNDHRHASAASVLFSPGARSAWHVHPAGQTLIVTAGSGWVQQWGGAKQEIKPGDVIWTPPGVKHWHGATDHEAMTHIATQELVDSKAVEWLEQVSDAQYRP